MATTVFVLEAAGSCSSLPDGVHGWRQPRHAWFCDGKRGGNLMLEAERELYTDAYFKKWIESSNSASAVIVPLVLELVDVKSVLDVGCGAGTFLRRFKNYGVQDIKGIDGDYV